MSLALTHLCQRLACGAATQEGKMQESGHEELSMACPFPGMDPYLERPEIWSDFHDSLIAQIRGALQPLLRPRYVALTQDRIYVVESERPIRPDVSVIRTSSRAPTPSPRQGVLEVDTPAVFDLAREEVREPLIHIVEPAAGNRLVTAIEVVSPTNKETREGRKAYLQKADELWGAGANLVEVDLWHLGDPIVRVTEERLESLRPWRYIVAVSRYEPPRQEVYAVRLDRHLPCVAIPLQRQDADVPLDVQAVFTRCWNEGPYPELLEYQGAPPGSLTPEEAHWAEGVLREHGLRTSPTA